MNDLTMDHLEAGLHELADRLEAPASDGTRHAIGRRTGVLRRRRQVRRATAAGALAVALVVGGAVALRHEPTDVEILPAHPPEEDDGALPAFTVDLDGWLVAGASEDQAGVEGTGDAEAALSATQVFRVPDRLDGPTVFLEHTSDSGEVTPPDGGQQVDIGGAVGYVAPLDDDHVFATWDPAGQDARVELRSWGLGTDEVVDFARGLQAKDDAIVYPATSEDRFGFTASELPGGIKEDLLDPGGAFPRLSRTIMLTHSGGTGQITLSARAAGDTSFGNELSGFEETTGVEQVTVLGRPALLLHDGQEPTRWIVQWLEADGTFVHISVTGETADRALVDQVMADLREVPETEWAELMAAHG
ncbi:MAG TPA: hypothetical protein VGO78_06525 [Acidimicrobiales bacterium]|jgi:hypothetical protein|nr:hypothetical protein [Acidimicrobiales bacterium]